MKCIDTFSNEHGIQITKEQFAQSYFDRINPKTKDGSRYMITQSVIGRIEKKIGTAEQPLRSFYEYLLDKPRDHNRLKRIVLSPPDLLHSSVIPNVKRKASALGISWSKIKVEELIKVLGYESIRKNHVTWLVRSLGLKACPYCGSQYLLNAESLQEKKSLCELDHFFPKKRYPFLAISVFNLIPSCGPCNRLKGEEETSLANYPHPYLDDLNQIFRFSTNPEDVIEKIIKHKQDIGIDIHRNLDLNTRQKRQTRNHIERFRLAQVYENHTDIAEELYWKKYLYNKSKRQELVEVFKNLDINEKEIDRFITGNYILDEDLHKRPLAKLTKDIWAELDKIKD